MKLLKISPAILLLPLLIACATAERPKIVSDACLNLRAITFAQLPAGQVDDPGNQADSDETVAEIGTHNAKYDALCPRLPEEGED